MAKSSVWLQVSQGEVQLSPLPTHLLLDRLACSSLSLVCLPAQKVAAFKGQEGHAWEKGERTSLGGSRWEDSGQTREAGMEETPSLLPGAR